MKIRHTKTKIMLECIICGKLCKIGENCFPKCEYIKPKMNSPFEQKLDDIDKVIDFFSKLWDKKHGNDKK